MRGYCSSFQCVHNYLMEHHTEFKKLQIQTVKIERKMKALNKFDLGFKAEQKKFKKELEQLKALSYSIMNPSLHKNGVLIEGDFRIGDDCNVCGWSLFVV